MAVCGSYWFYKSLVDMISWSRDCCCCFVVIVVVVVVIVVVVVVVVIIVFHCCGEICVLNG